MRTSFCLKSELIKQIIEFRDHFPGYSYPAVNKNREPKLPVFNKIKTDMNYIIPFLEPRYLSMRCTIEVWLLWVEICFR